MIHNRRGFALGALAAGLSAATYRVQAAIRPLRILVLGGTGNIGPYHVRAAVARGHKVAALIWNKTTQHAALPASVELLPGDRDGDLSAITDRDWDAVLDLATFGPGWVRSLGQALLGRVRHYSFVSTVSVYDLDAPGERIDETHPVLQFKANEDPYTIESHDSPYYGELKALCEQEAEHQFPGKTCIFRPGYIGGPDDTHDELVYWPLRMEKGGEMLAAGDVKAPVQYIDVRDMAEWMVRCAEAGTTGIYNTVGPLRPTDTGSIIRAAARSAGTSAKVTWVPSDWLDRRPDRQLWGSLRFWENNRRALATLSNRRAVAAGLTTRALSMTLADTLAWWKQQPADRQAVIKAGFRRKTDGSGFERVSMPWNAYLESERAALTAWHSR